MAASAPFVTRAFHEFESSSSKHKKDRINRE